MNIFVLDSNPVKAAQLQCNAHVVKMIVESAQMLSTAHRMLDGKLTRGPSKSGKTMSKKWIHPDPQLDAVLYRAVHMAHPCTVWTMESSWNYAWHLDHWRALCAEYTYRYGKVHSSYKLLDKILEGAPVNIKYAPATPFKLAMKSNPECMFPDDPVKSYRLFYQTKQDRFKMVWTKRPVPEWFKVKEAA